MLGHATLPCVLFQKLRFLGIRVLFRQGTWVEDKFRWPSAPLLLKYSAGNPPTAEVHVDINYRILLL